MKRKPARTTYRARRPPAMAVTMETAADPEADASTLSTSRRMIHGTASWIATRRNVLAVAKERGFMYPWTYLRIRWRLFLGAAGAGRRLPDLRFRDCASPPFPRRPPALDRRLPLFPVSPLTRASRPGSPCPPEGLSPASRIR